MQQPFLQLSFHSHFVDQARTCSETSFGSLALCRDICNVLVESALSSWSSHAFHIDWYCWSELNKLITSSIHEDYSSVVRFPNQILTGSSPGIWQRNILFSVFVLPCTNVVKWLFSAVGAWRDWWSAKLSCMMFTKMYLVMWVQRVWSPGTKILATRSCSKCLKIRLAAM